MRTAWYLVHLVETLAHLLLAAGRVSFEESLRTDLLIGVTYQSRVQEYVIDRYMELVFAGQGS